MSMAHRKSSKNWYTGLIFYNRKLNHERYGKRNLAEKMIINKKDGIFVNPLGIYTKRDPF